MNASSLIQSKLLELCQAVVADDEVKNARQQAESFLADESAVSLYRDMASLGRSLHQKQHQGEQPTSEEISRFHGLQDRCEANDLVSRFLKAQELLGSVAETVNTYLGRSLESGRVPTAEEMSPKQGSCGEGCGCH
jgi:cell fate (sporulation/competence/biofilm development) regulator YlbF (YheA/YmcA/DUF963 family)